MSDIATKSAADAADFVSLTTLHPAVLAAVAAAAAIAAAVALADAASVVAMQKLFLLESSLCQCCGDLIGNGTLD